MKRILFLVFTVLCFCSCCRSGEDKEMIRIYRQKYGSKPDYAFRMSDNKILYIKKEEGPEIYAPFQLFFLDRKGKEWISSRETEIAEGCFLDSVEMVTIDQKKFLYFEVGQLGGSMGDQAIEFALYDFKTDAKYSIEYEQYPEAGITVTQFNKSDNLQSHPLYKKYLESRIKKSARIFKPDAREKLIRAFKSANKGQITQLEDPEATQMLIRFKAVTTKEMLFKIPPEDDPESEEATIVSSADNGDYVVVSYFKGPVLAFRKSTREYFCVYVPPMMDEYIAHVEFNKAGNLVFNSEAGGKPYCLVDLYELVYQRHSEGDGLK